jgi:hypothetical protein
MAELILVSGEKGGTGKSFVCRAMVQWHLDHKMPCTVFDTDRSNPDIKRCYGRVTDVNLGIFGEGQRYEDTANAVFNAAMNNRTIVNLPAQVFIPVKTWVEQNDLFEIAQDVGVTFTIWFVSDCGHDSLTLLRKSLDYFKTKAHHVVVKNYGKTDDWQAYEQEASLQELIQTYHATVIDFPKFIGSVVRNRIDELSLTFGEALTHEKFDIIERQRVRKFLREAYAAFDSAGVFDGR